jgi:hypothetical protein
MFKHKKILFWRSFSAINFFSPKFMKLRWYSFFFGSFAHHFQTKLSTHGSNLNFVFVSKNELEFFLLMGVLTQNSNILELVKFLEKKHIEDNIMLNHEQKKKLKKK